MFWTMDPPEISWSVDIGSISPAAPVWDTSYQVLDRSNQSACDKCGKTYKHRKSLKKHMQVTPNCELTQQNIPGRFYGDFEQLSKLICKASCKPVKQDSNDKKSDQEPNDQEPNDHPDCCQICLIPLSSPDKGQIHREEYARVFQCCKCKKVLGNRQKLKSHYRTHTKEKPFQCNFCEKIFSECSSLRKHLLTHGPRKYKCDSCSKRFIRKDYLYKHTRTRVCLK